MLYEWIQQECGWYDIRQSLVALLSLHFPIYENDVVRRFIVRCHPHTREYECMLFFRHVLPPLFEFYFLTYDEEVIWK